MIYNLHSVLMIRPSSFRVNKETLKNNFFQSEVKNISNDFILNQALIEFDDLVDKIKLSGVKVLVYQDDLKFDTPDSIFPNNWISFHENKIIATYPMFANNRRLERSDGVIAFLEKSNIEINQVFDYSKAENSNLFLEGTGSMVLDRINKKAYCSLSERTNESLIEEFCDDFKFMPIVFNSFHTVKLKRQVIYHTNVMMCLARKYAVICLDSIDDNQERDKVVQSLEDDNKELIIISENQLSSFAGNMIELETNNDSFIVMSQTAYDSLDYIQIKKIEKHSKIISSSVDIIEKCGGGSVRCMIAEIFN